LRWTCWPARDLLEGIFLTRTRAEWLEALQANDVPCAPVRRREVWFASETVAEGGLRKTFTHTRHGEVAMPAPARAAVGHAGVDQSAAAAHRGAAGLASARRREGQGRGATPGRCEGAEPRHRDRRGLCRDLLSNFGADVLKIEPPEADPFRSTGRGSSRSTAAAAGWG
jgi:crotonobetainyl-CoA:carnitine CoA-transferase CaiB-like acyl-CoA transferase